MEGFVHIASFATLLLLARVVSATSSPSSLELDSILQPFFEHLPQAQLLRPLMQNVGPQLLKIFQQHLNTTTNEIEDYTLDEKIFVTSDPNATTMISVYGLIFSLLWMLAVSIIASMVVCYWVGCEYEDSSEQGYYRQLRSVPMSFDPYAIDWEKFSILDWISIGEEAWRKFDPADLDCQKRLICEIHQNTSRFGAAASKMVDLFSYLQYAEVLSLPEEFKALIEEYLDAADRGRNLQKECGEIYSSCEFSVKKMVDKYNHNEI